MPADRLNKFFQFSTIIEMFTEAIDKLPSGIPMALRAALLEAVDRGERADLPA